MSPPRDDDDVSLPDIRSPEYRRALRERGKPHGDHIKPDHEDGAPRPHIDGITAALAALVDLRDEYKTKSEPPPPPPSPKTWSSAAIILGVLVSSISIVTAGITAIQSYGKTGEQVQAALERLGSVETRVSVVERDLQVRGRARDQEMAALTASNGLQDDRMQNQTEALKQERQARIDNEADTRKAIAANQSATSDILRILSDMKADIKVMADRATRQRSDVGTPERDARNVGPAPR